MPRVIRNWQVRFGLALERIGPWGAGGGSVGLMIGNHLNPGTPRWIIAVLLVELAAVAAIGVWAPVHKRLGLRKSDVIISERG